MLAPRTREHGNTGTRERADRDDNHGTESDEEMKDGHGDKNANDCNGNGNVTSITNASTIATTHYEDVCDIGYHPCANGSM